MKKHVVSVLLLLVLTFGAIAQKVDPVEKDIRANVAYLAGDALEGRRTGEPSATTAAGYIANLFAQYKLKPGVRDARPASAKLVQSFMQRFPYTTGVEIAPDGNEFKVAGAALNDGIKPYLFSPNAVVENATVVFAGYGIESAEANYNDFTGLDVAGKILLIFDGNPENDNPRSPLGRFTLHAKSKLAKDKGAIGILVISREDNFANDRNANARYDQSNGETALPVFAISRAVAAASFFGSKDFDLAALEQIIALKKKLNVSFTLNFGAVKSTTAGFKLNLVKKQSDAYNVVGIVEGNDAVLREEYVVIGAHYDHLGRGGAGSLAANSTEIHHGADDNASGTAAMLALARQYAKSGKNKRTLVFIAFSGEEEGLLGSKYYVNNPLVPLEKTVAMLNMDMVGRLTDKKLTVGGIGTANEWKDLVTKKNEVILPVYDSKKTANFTAPAEQVYRFNLQLNEDGFGPSDHSSFYGKQVPVLFFFTGTHADYHKPSDTAEKINYAGLIDLVVYVGDILGYVADMTPKPTYKVAQSSGQGEGRRGFAVTIRVVPGYGEANDGMVVDGVPDGGPAAIAGIKAGDKIISFAGKEIRNVQDYTFVLGDLKADVEYDIVVMRAGQKIALKVKPAARK